MTAILRVTTRWSGFPGGPGYTTFHFRDFGTGTAVPPIEDAEAAAVKTLAFFSAVRDYLPASTSIDVQEEVEIVEDTTGELIDVLSTTAGGIVSGAGVGVYSGPAGAVVNWRTNVVKNGRRIRGRTFLVPLTGNAFSADGGLGPSPRTLIIDAANALIAEPGTPDLGVYSRPSAAGATDGQWAVVSSSTVPTMAAVLRSRRD